MRLRHVHLQQITIRALNAPSIPLSPPSDHFAVHLTHLIAKNNTDNRMEVVFLWVDRPWIAYIHMWRCVVHVANSKKETQTRGRTREEEKNVFDQDVGNATREISKGLAQQIGSFQGCRSNIYFRLSLFCSIIYVQSSFLSAHYTHLMLKLMRALWF